MRMLSNITTVVTFHLHADKVSAPSATASISRSEDDEELTDSTKITLAPICTTLSARSRKIYITEYHTHSIFRSPETYTT